MMMMDIHQKWYHCVICSPGGGVIDPLALNTRYTHLHSCMHYVSGNQKTKCLSCEVNIPVRKSNCGCVQAGTEASQGSSVANPASTRWSGPALALGRRQTPHSWRGQRCKQQWQVDTWWRGIPRRWGHRSSRAPKYWRDKTHPVLQNQTCPLHYEIILLLLS